MLILIFEFALPIFGALLLLTAVTLAVEAPIYFLGYAGEKYSFKYKFWVFVLINVITFSTFMAVLLGISIFTVFDPFDPLVSVPLLIVQIITVLTEAFVYKKAFKISVVKPLILSAVSNVVSTVAVFLVIFALEM